MSPAVSILVYGIGNPGREDDGAGTAVAQKIEAAAPAGVAVRIDYQLNVEDALEISDKDAVIFIDASVADIGSFRFRKAIPEPSTDFTTHSMSPGGVLGLCSRLYGKLPHAWVLEIKGYGWEMREGLTEQAKANCEEAYFFVTNIFETIFRDGVNAVSEYSLKEQQSDGRGNSDNR